MTRYRTLGALLTALLALTLALPAAGYAQQAEPTPTPAPTEQPVVPTALPTSVPLLKSGDPDFYSLTDLSQSEVALRGPFDRSTVSFTLPASWQVGDGAQVQLDMAVFVAGAGAAPSTPFGGLLIVRLNGERVGVINIDRVGDRAELMSLPAALFGTRADGRNDLSFELDMGFTCDLDLQANVILRERSGLLLPHTVGALPTALELLPRPIYQRSALIAAPALVVVPDAPSAEELQAALTTATAFGRITSGQLALSLVAAGALTEEQRAQSHLIFVGKPDAFADLASAPFPAPLGQATLSVSGAGADDGVLQMIASPWNPERALLSVSGSSPAGLVKAAQSISNDAVRSYVQPNLALVQEVRMAPAATSAATDRSFADLGYVARTVSDRGSQTTEFLFEVPAGQVPNGESYIDLTFSHSAQMDYSRSGATVLLNDLPVGSLQFSQSSNSMDVKRIELPQSAIRAGTNSLVIQSDLNHYIGCSDRNLASLWFTIWPETLLHLPLTAGTPSPALLGLGAFPSAFIARPDLSSTLFVLGQGDPAGWAAAAQIAFELGRRSDGSLAAPGAVYSEGLTSELRAGRDLIVVGRATRLPVVAEIGAALPAPFAAGSDYADERALAVQYRVAPGASVGYLQAVASPWSAEHVLLAVQGSDDASVGLASTALVTPANRARLAGSLVVVSGTQLIGGVAAAPTPAPVTAPDQTPGAVVARGMPGWIIPAIIGAIALMGVVIVVALVGALRRRGAR